MSEAPVRVFNGQRGQRVFLAETPSRSDYVHAAFSEVRLAAVEQPYVMRALIEVLGDLLTELEGAELTCRMEAVAEELRLTIEAARVSEIPDEDVRRILGSRYEQEAE